MWFASTCAVSFPAVPAAVLKPVDPPRLIIPGETRTILVVDAGGYRRAAFAGTPDHYRPIDRAETLKAGRLARSNDNAVGPYRRCLTGRH
jgi:hypothetical protein